MSFTRTYVVNLALAIIGTERVNDYTDDDASAQLARDVWEVAYKEALAVHEWRFATKVSGSLARSTDPVAGYLYTYQPPADFVRINGVYDSSDMTTPVRDYALRQGLIHADREALYIEYVYDHSTVGSWPAWFVNYVAAVLAYHLSSMLKSTTETERFMKMAMQRLGFARSMDSTQQPVRKPPPGTWIQALRGNYRTI